MRQKHRSWPNSQTMLPVLVKRCLTGQQTSRVWYSPGNVCCSCWNDLGNHGHNWRRRTSWRWMVNCSSLGRDEDGWNWKWCRDNLVERMIVCLMQLWWLFDISEVVLEVWRLFDSDEEVVVVLIICQWGGARAEFIYQNFPRPESDGTKKRSSSARPTWSVRRDDDVAIASAFAKHVCSDKGSRVDSR